jgi:hypothetical protein
MQGGFLKTEYSNKDCLANQLTILNVGPWRAMPINYDWYILDYLVNPLVNLTKITKT